MCEQSVKLYNYIKLEQPYVYLIFFNFCWPGNTPWSRETLSWIINLKLQKQMLLSCIIFFSLFHSLVDNFQSQARPHTLMLLFFLLWDKHTPLMKIVFSPPKYLNTFGFFRKDLYITTLIVYYLHAMKYQMPVSCGVGEP